MAKTWLNYRTSNGKNPSPEGPTLYDYGLAYFCMGDLEESVTLVERAVALHAKHPVFLGIIAVVYAHLGRDQAARLGLKVICFALSLNGIIRVSRYALLLSVIPWAYPQ
jgi:hypothetical protein